MSDETLQEDRSEKPLTIEDFEAADEALWNSNTTGLLRQTQRELMAQLHSHYGRSKFRLYFNLRKPRTEYERLMAWAYQKQLNDEEYSDVFRHHVERPVDKLMLDEWFQQAQLRLKQYSLGMQTIANMRLSKFDRRNLLATEEKVSAHFKRTRAILPMDNAELRTLSKFFDRVRLDRRMGNAVSHEYIGTNVMELIFNVFDITNALWKSCREIAHRSKTLPNYLYEIDAAELLYRTSGPKLPGSRELITLLRQEVFAGEVTLEETRPKSEKPVEVDNTKQNQSSEPLRAQIQIAQADIHIDVATLRKALAEAPITPTEPLLKVNDWSELGIGMDERGRYWAYKPCPDFGSSVRLSDAIQLDLAGNQWRKLIEAFAESEYGCVITIEDLNRKFGYLPPPSSVSSDRNVRSSDVVRQLKSELPSGGSLDKTAVQRIAKDLGRKLRKLVDGPLGKPSSCFTTEEKQIRCGFAVRFLFKSDNRTYSFGKNQ